MTKTPPNHPTDSLDSRSLLVELLRTQQERDRVWAERELLKEQLVFARQPAEVAPVDAVVSEPLPARIGRLADQLVSVARELRQYKAAPAPPAPDPEILLAQKRELRELAGELENSRAQVETLETQLRYLEISGRGRASGSGADEELGQQLGAALEREDQLLIRLHQMETTLSHRQADQLVLLEKDKQIQQLKYFLHQGALDFEKLQTRHRVVEAESLEQKHRIIELQTSLERNQDSSRNTIRRLQEQVSAQSRQLADGERALRAAETRQENLEDEVDRLSAQIFQMEERLSAGAGQLELARYEAARVPALVLRVQELEDGMLQVEEENLALREQAEQMGEALSLLEENAGALDSRVSEDAAAIEQLNLRLEENTSRRTADQEAELQREREAQAAEHERNLVAAMELLDRKEDSLRSLDERLRSTSTQLQALQEKHNTQEAQLAEVTNAARDSKREAEVLTRELEVKAKALADLERAAKVAAESAGALKDELARQTEKMQAGGDRKDQELAMRAERIQELENTLATQRIEVQRLSGQIKTAEMKNTEVLHWSDKLKTELMQVRAQLDEEIQKRSGSEEQARLIEGQLPEIRRLFDEIEHQVDGFEDNLALEEDRTQRLSESLDQLVGSIGSVFQRITEQLAHLEAERGLLADRLQTAELEHFELAGEAGAQNAEKNRATIHDLNVQLGIMEGNLLTMQVKMQNQLGPSVEKILRVTGDLELLGMINAATELRSIAGTLSGLLQ
ncbi:hypothetical protein KJ975_06085 [Myxococcota bacterium]|nr:hypothetical protein [Myxococcota bacterium]